MNLYVPYFFAALSCNKSLNWGEIVKLEDMVIYLFFIECIYGSKLFTPCNSIVAQPYLASQV